MNNIESVEVLFIPRYSSFLEPVPYPALQVKTKLEGAEKAAYSWQRLDKALLPNPRLRSKMLTAALKHARKQILKLIKEHNL